MMEKIQRIACVAILAVVALLLARSVVPAYEDSALVLSFNPVKDASARYMFQLAMQGAHVTPGLKDQMVFGEFMIGTVYKDTVKEALHGLNRHTIQFYEYNVRELQGTRSDRSDPRFGGNPWPVTSDESGGDSGGGTTPPGEGGGGGGTTPPGGGGGGGGTTPPGGGGGGGGTTPPGGGGGAGGSSSFVGPVAVPAQSGGAFVSGLGLPSSSSSAPMQSDGGGTGDGGDGGRNPDEPGGGGGLAGKVPTSINLDTIQVTSLDYVTNKQGEVLDVGGLDTLRKVSQNRLVSQDDDQYKSYIDINITHVFEWSHLLYLPTYPIYKEDIWFHSYPIHVPGLPVDQPLLTKFMYRLVDLRRLGSRKVAVIDMTGVAEWNTEWDDKTSETLTEFKSWGKMGFSARYWFDYEKGMIFGIERPPFYDMQYNRYYEPLQRIYPYDGQFAMEFPGLVVLLDMFYNTRVTDISDKPRLQKEAPKEQRRYIALQILSQLESE
jgi:hypothetical protein